MQVDGNSFIIEEQNNGESVKEFFLEGIIDAIIINGSGDITIKADEVELSKELKLTINGAGNIFFSSEKNKKIFKDFVCSINGSGNIKVKNIECENVKAEANGSGDIFLADVNSKIADFFIYGSGNIVTENVKCEKINKNTKGKGCIR